MSVSESGRTAAAAWDPHHEKARRRAIVCVHGRRVSFGWRGRRWRWLSGTILRRGTSGACGAGARMQECHELMSDMHMQMYACY